MKSPASCSFTYEAAWMDGLFDLVIRSVRLLITGWNLVCLFGWFVHWKVVCLVDGWVGWLIDYLNI